MAGRRRTVARILAILLSIFLSKIPLQLSDYGLHNAEMAVLASVVNDVVARGHINSQIAPFVMQRGRSKNNPLAFYQELFRVRSHDAHESATD